jgi:HSP20 family protein
MRREPPVEVDLGLGGIAKGLGNFVRILSELAQTTGGEIVREREFEGRGSLKGVKGVYGFSVRVADGGPPQVQTFGNIKQTEKGATVEEVREPMVDVFQENDTIQIIAELPGVAADSINLDLQGDVLTICAEEGDRKYSKELLLPAKVDPASLEKTYRNGILEITARKASAETT